MKAALRFVPSVLIGLGVGWFAAGRIVANRAAGVEPAHPAPTTAMPSAQPVPEFGRGALRERLDAIAPLPSLPDPPAPDDDGRGYHRYRVEIMGSFNEVTKIGATSPYRSQLFSEALHIGTLPTVGIGGPNPERTLARLAEERPSYALSEAGARLHRGFTGHDLGDAQSCRRAVLRTWLRDDPEAALLEVTKKGVSRNRAISNFNRGMTIHAMMREWGELDPAAAAAALPELPESGRAFSHAHFAESLVEGWFQRDPASARQWIETDAKPEWREGLAELVSMLESGDPAATSDVLWKLP